MAELCIPPEFCIPVVDISGFASPDPAQRLAVARQFGAALESAGFVTIIGHGIAPEIGDACYRLTRGYFAQDLAAKLAHTMPELAKTRGYLPMGIESVAATLGDTQPPDLCEALVFAAAHRDGTPAAKGNIWPAEPPGLAAAIRAYNTANLALGQTLMRISALALDLPEDYFAAWHADPMATLRLVMYPDQPDEPMAGQLRYGAHQDYGGLTILRQDSAPGGLQVADAQGNWHDAPPIADSFVINVGDLIAHWTGGRWRATLHRVINPPRHLTGSTSRLSMVMFFNANEDSIITPLPGHAGDAAPITAGAYVRGRIHAAMAGQARDKVEATADL